MFIWFLSLCFFFFQFKSVIFFEKEVFLSLFFFEFIFKWCPFFEQGGRKKRKTKGFKRYRSTLDALDALYDKVQPGGIVVHNNWQYTSARSAVSFPRQRFKNSRVFRKASARGGSGRPRGRAFRSKGRRPELRVRSLQDSRLEGHTGLFERKKGTALLIKRTAVGRGRIEKVSRRRSVDPILRSVEF